MREIKTVCSMGGILVLFHLDVGGIIIYACGVIAASSEGVMDRSMGPTLVKVRATNVKIRWWLSGAHFYDRECVCLEDADQGS